MVWNIFAVIGVTVVIALLGAGTWVWAVVVRNAYTAFLSARSSTTIPHSVNVALPGIKLFVSAGNLVVHPASNEVN